MKAWLLTAQIDGRRVQIGDFDHQFEGWAARKHLLETRPEAKQPLVQLNPIHRLPLPGRTHTGDYV